MTCPVCVLGIFGGSWLVNTRFESFAFQPGRSISTKLAVMTASYLMTQITALAIKNIFNISLCGSSGTFLKRVLISGVIGASITLVYCLAINYLLNRYFPVSKQRSEAAEEI